MEVGIEEELESLGERVEGRSERELFTAIKRESCRVEVWMMMMMVVDIDKHSNSTCADEGCGSVVCNTPQYIYTIYYSGCLFPRSVYESRVPCVVWFSYLGLRLRI